MDNGQGQQLQMKKSSLVIEGDESTTNTSSTYYTSAINNSYNNNRDQKISTQAVLNHMFGNNIPKSSKKTEFIIEEPDINEVNHNKSTILNDYEMDIQQDPIESDIMQDEVNNDTNDNYAIHVVLDCANIGHFYGMDRFNARGVSAAFEYFDNNFDNVKVIGFIPAAMVWKRPKDGSRTNAMMETDEWDILHKLVQERRVIVVPAGDNDDLYIISCAISHDSFIITNDFYHDHINNDESNNPQSFLRSWIAERRCCYTFVDCMLMLSPLSPFLIAYNSLGTSQNNEMEI